MLSGSILAVFIIFTFFNTPVESSSADTESALKLMAKAIDGVERVSYKKQELKDIVYAGVNGMMRTLDPYSNFLDEDVFKYMHEQQEGSFFGIGISFDLRNGQLLVISPIEDSPAWKLGIKPGDVIVKINGKSTAGITTSEVLKVLRGKKNSRVNITVKRPDVDEPLEFEIIRDKIELNSVRGGFVLDKKIGYVRVTEFAMNTGKELESAIDKLVDQNINGLILDLRFNGGGLLTAAEDVSSLFLKKKQMIVTTRGRHRRNMMELKTKSDGKFKDLPLIILVNSNSASASEIVAGAIQDYDRGLIVGADTHGKGLVGSQFTTLFGTAVQVTTAQYFTPSGRFIQRPYDIPHRHVSGNKEDSGTQSDSKDLIYHTNNGREVYGGGGITPDIKIEDSVLTATMFQLENKGLFFDFAIKHGEFFRDTATGLDDTTDTLDAFVKFAAENGVIINETALGENRDQIKVSLSREFLSVYKSTVEGERVRVANSAQVQEALDLFPKISSILQGKEAASASPLAESNQK